MPTTTNGEKGDINNNEVPGSKMRGEPQRSYHRAVGYEIRVKDHLDTYWFEWFEGWSFTNLDDGVVLLKSNRVDQSRLHGALNKIRDLNLTLISVTCVPEND